MPTEYRVHVYYPMNLTAEDEKYQPIQVVESAARGLGEAEELRTTREGMDYRIVRLASPKKVGEFVTALIERSEKFTPLTNHEKSVFKVGRPVEYKIKLEFDGQITCVPSAQPKED